MAPETETPVAPPEVEASASSAAGQVTGQAVRSEAGAATDVAVTSETGAKSRSGDKSDTGGKSKSSGKSKTASKKSKGKDKAAAADTAAAISVAAHPRAAARVAEAKAWGGLAGFVLGGYLSLSTYTLVDAGLRALAAGVFCYIVVWAASVFIWRRIIAAELRQAEQDLLSANIAARQLAALPPGEPVPAGVAS